MTQASGDTNLIDPTSSNKMATTLGEQQLAQSPIPSFPNTRYMTVTTDLSRNPGIYDDVFKKIKGLRMKTERNKNFLFVKRRSNATDIRRCKIIYYKNSQ